jgi:hypothetical protein
MEFHLRRTWNGKSVFVGPARLVYPTGSTAAEADVSGQMYGTVPDMWIGDRCYKYYQADGTPLTWGEWFQYIAEEYLPNADAPLNGKRAE